ncbi:unnamed protein product [Ranitomeya imitator]|uniref:Gamma-tubulin complex component n=1 Tax=Ranitomeya imitator TaxID=111125 RepID=A0ABN9MBN9_9NEOB|nr:unnamed protein product [Ranitomeya imitator]
MLWGCVANAGTGNLVKVERCMDSSQYRQILDNNVHESVTKLKLRRGWIFQQDNDPKHRSKSAQVFMQRNNYTVLEWPSQSPDLNIIEHLPHKVSLLTPAHVLDHLKFANDHLDDPEDAWQKVMCSDETNIELFGINSTRRVWRKKVEYNLKNTVPTMKHGEGNIILWGDNDPKHTSRLCKGYLTKKESDGVLRQMTWPPQSPDLNPIEMVWGELDRRVKAKGPTSAKHLWKLLQDCWKTIPAAAAAEIYDMAHLWGTVNESVQSRLQHGKELGPDSITEQQVNKQSLIKMQSIVAKHLELNDVHDPLLAINFARLYLEQSDFLDTFTCEDISVDRSSESVTCQSFELTLRSCLYPHIDKQYLECCGNLMQTLKEDYKLVEYLQSMRNFFLLEAGDTMYDFYTSIFDKIREKEQWQNVVFLNVQLQEAVSQRYPEDSTRLSIFFENVDLAKKKLPVHTLDGLVLSYKVPWPVDIVISSECQKIYNQIFLLLLLIKWAKYSLDVLQFNALASMAEKESPKNESRSVQQHLLGYLVTQTESKEQQIHRMFLLRVKLMHFVNSLHNYMMTRILHSTGLEFQHQVEEAKDLDQLIKIHYRYLSTIHDRCLLREKVSSVKEAIMKVMNVVLMFADRWHAGFGAWKAESILKMESDFTNCHKFLVKVLNKAVCRGSFPHLESLALSLMAGMEQS